VIASAGATPWRYYENTFASSGTHARQIGNMRVTVLLFALLATVTLLSVRYVVRYEEAGPEILRNGWVIPKQDKALVKNEGGIFSLSSQDRQKKVGIYQKAERPGSGDFVRLEADMMSREIIPGEKSWNQGLFFLVQYDASGKGLKTDRMVTMIKGTREWVGYQKVFQISPETATFRVYAQLSRCTGSMQIKNIRLYPVTESSVYPWIKNMILGTWALFFLSMLRSYRIEGNFWGQIFLILCYGGILFATTIPDELRDRLMESIGLKGNMMDMIFLEAMGLKIDKIGHFLVFALFGASLVLFVPGMSFFAIGVHICMLAGGTELVQILIDSRSANVFDFYLDFFGGLAGILFVGIFSGARNRIVQKRELRDISPGINGGKLRL